MFSLLFTIFILKNFFPGRFEAACLTTIYQIRIKRPLPERKKRKKSNFHQVKEMLNLKKPIKEVFDRMVSINERINYMELEQRKVISSSLFQRGAERW